MTELEKLKDLLTADNIPVVSWDWQENGSGNMYEFHGIKYPDYESEFYSVSCGVLTLPDGRVQSCTSGGNVGLLELWSPITNENYGFLTAEIVYHKISKHWQQHNHKVTE